MQRPTHNPTQTRTVTQLGCVDVLCFRTPWVGNDDDRTNKPQPRNPPIDPFPFPAAEQMRDVGRQSFLTSTCTVHWVPPVVAHFWRRSASIVFVFALRRNPHTMYQPRHSHTISFFGESSFGRTPSYNLTGNVASHAPRSFSIQASRTGKSSRRAEYWLNSPALWCCQRKTRTNGWTLGSSLNKSEPSRARSHHPHTSASAL